MLYGSQSPARASLCTLAVPLLCLALAGCQPPVVSDPVPTQPAAPELARVPSRVVPAAAAAELRVETTAATVSCGDGEAVEVAVAPDPTGYLIRDLLDPLSRCGDELVVSFAPDVSWRTGVRVLYTAGQAAVKTVHLLVEGPRGIGQLTAHFPTIAMAPTDDMPDAERCVSPTVHLASDATSLRARWTVDGPMYAERAVPDAAQGVDLSGLGADLAPGADSALAGVGGFGTGDGGPAVGDGAPASGDPPAKPADGVGAVDIPLAVEAMGVRLPHVKAVPDAPAIERHLRALRGFGAPCMDAVVSADDDLQWGRVAVVMAAIQAENYRLVPAVAEGETAPATGVWPELSE